MTNIDLSWLDEAYELLVNNSEKPALLITQAEELESYALRFEEHGQHNKAEECKIGAQQSREMAAKIKSAEQNLLNALAALINEVYPNLIS